MAPKKDGKGAKKPPAAKPPVEKKASKAAAKKAAASGTTPPAPLHDAIAPEPPALIPTVDEVDMSKNEETKAEEMDELRKDAELGAMHEGGSQDARTASSAGEESIDYGGDEPTVRDVDDSFVKKGKSLVEKFSGGEPAKKRQRLRALERGNRASEEKHIFRIE